MGWLWMEFSAGKKKPFCTFCFHFPKIFKKSGQKWLNRSKSQDPITDSSLKINKRTKRKHIGPFFLGISLTAMHESTLQYRLQKVCSVQLVSRKRNLFCHDMCFLLSTFWSKKLNWIPHPNKIWKNKKNCVRLWKLLSRSIFRGAMNESHFQCRFWSNFQKRAHNGGYLYILPWNGPSGFAPPLQVEFLPAIKFLDLAKYGFCTREWREEWVVHSYIYVKHRRVRNIQFLWANQKASFNRESTDQSQPRKGAFSGISIKNGA